MIKKASISKIMETDMKVNGKMPKSMAKVRKKLFMLWLILILFDDSKGKWFGNNGDRYEGEWRDGNMHG